jgi:CBS domain-containing protein
MKKFSTHIINSSATLKDGLISINKLADEILCLFVINEEEHLVGTVTDGDIRRALIAGVELKDSIVFAMNKNYVKVLLGNVSPTDIKNYRLKGITTGGPSRRARTRGRARWRGRRRPS